MRFVSLIALMSLGLSVSPAAGFTLRYDALDGCPPAAALRAAVVEGLGTAPAEGAETVAVRVAPDRTAATVALLDAGGASLGERRVRSTQGDCEALVRAAGLGAGLALAPLRLAADEEQVTAAELPDPAPPSAITAAPWTVRAGWGGAVGFGLHPGAALTLDGGLHLGRGRWSGAVELWLSGAPAWLDGAVADGRVRSGAVGGGVWGCADVAAFTSCLGALAGVEGHVGVDFSRDAESVGPWLAGALRAQWRVVGEWGPRALLWVPISRLTLTVDGASVWSTPPVGGGLGLGGRL